MLAVCTVLNFAGRQAVDLRAAAPATLARLAAAAAPRLRRLRLGVAADSPWCQWAGVEKKGRSKWSESGQRVVKKW